MLGLPKSTEFNRRIPKQKFYDNMNVSPNIKKLFVEQVKVIYWRNKIATTTMNLSSGIYVTEIEVFEIQLKRPMLDDTLLRQIDKAIPYHILFILEYQGQYQAWIGYKEAVQSKQAYKVNNYYHTDWMQKEALSIKIDGLNVDVVYENLVRQIAGDSLKTTNITETLKESIDKDEQKQKIQKQIDKLQTKMRKEKQFNKQVEINSEIKKLKKEMEKLVNG